MVFAEDLLEGQGPGSDSGSSIDKVVANMQGITRSSNLRWPKLGFLRPPQYPADPEKTLRGEILFFWIYLAFFTYGVVTISYMSRACLLEIVQYTILPLGSACVSFWLVQRRNERLAASVFCFGVLAGLMVCSFSAGGLGAPATSALALPMIVAGLTLGRKAMLLLFLAVMLYLFFLAGVQVSGRLPSPAYILTPWHHAFGHSVIAGSVLAVMGWTTWRLEASRKLLHVEIENRRSAEKETLLLNAVLEDRVRDRTAELDAFTSMVAHDLRAPLRHVRSYSSMLQEKSDELDEEGQFFVSRLGNSAKNMSELVERLLEFSRANRSSLRRASFDMTELVESIQFGLIESGEIGPDWIKVEPLLPTEADLMLVRQVWINLLDNAVKFTKQRPQPTIRVFSERKDGVVWYVVQDNGVGFESEDAERIFKQFERAHASSAFPGSGIGLSTVKRIVERHGGKIVASGEPDKGACFAFTLSEQSNRG